MVSQRPRKEWGLPRAEGQEAPGLLEQRVDEHTTSREQVPLASATLGLGVFPGSYETLCKAVARQCLPIFLQE